jgi:WD40 repeat protein
MENCIKEKYTINSKEYTLDKDGKSYIIIIKQSDYRIIITSRQYQLMIDDLQEFYKTNGYLFESFNDLYKFIIDLFDKNRAYISFLSNNFMNIILRIFEEKIELNLPFYNLIPDLINFPKNLTYDAFTYYNYTNTFLIFNSINNNKLFLVFTTQEKNVKIYDIIDKKLVLEIRNSTEDNKQITNFRHFYDEYNKRDLIMFIIGIKNCIKIWDAYNWECILELKNIYKEGNIYSSLILNDNIKNDLYIITSNCTLFKDSQPLKIYDLKGNFIKDIPDSNSKTFFLHIFHDIRHSKKYIISVNKEFVKSFDYEKNCCYKKYSDKPEGKKINFDGFFYSSVIKFFDDNDFIQLIVSGDDGFIRIWDFHEGNLIKKIETDKNCIFSLCLWNNDYLFGAGEDGRIKLIDLNAGVIINEIKGHNKMVCTIKKLIHPIYGECLVSQGFRKDQIILWRNKNE